MAIYKCKMCGGDLGIAEQQTVAVCDYCGTNQTVPRAKNENLAPLFNRANALRIKSDFDKAEKIYEKILESDDTQAEAYWGLILCRYGIEYVEDPVTLKRIPTCHRTSYDVVTADEDFKSALVYADALSRSVYEAEAKEIDRIQKEIISLSANEEPYDVFICYKQTDENGRRTPDSVIANDIYYQLTNEGLKVFYAAITLEDKLGSAYEPCIFAALNSAKVMLAVGTKPEYFNAVWVRNEWSRYLKLIKKDPSRLLIPCYKDMDPYDLPEEFAHIQSQDMTKIGFINDVVRGINKVVNKSAVGIHGMYAPTEPAQYMPPLLKRAFICLEDGEFDRADDFCEQVLNVDPECAMAYLCKLMIQLRIKNQSELGTLSQPYDNNSNYLKAVRFADNRLRAELYGYVAASKERNVDPRLVDAYNEAKSVYSSAVTEDQYEKAARLFDDAGNYSDAVILSKQCRDKISELKDAKIRCYTLIEQLKAAYNSSGVGSDVQTLSEKIKQLMSKKATLEAAMANLTVVGEQLKQAVDGCNFLQYKLDNLRREREGLSVFAVVRKFEINEEETRAQEEFRRLKTLEISLKEKCGGYASTEECTEELNAVTSEIEKTRQQIDAVNSTPTMSKEEIMAELRMYPLGRELLSSFEVPIKKISVIPSGCRVGDHINFGRYNQFGSGDKSPVEWQVLEINNNKMLVVSKYAIDCKAYSNAPGAATWEDSSLRAWLNGEFYVNCFSSEEQSAIACVTVTAEDNPQFGVSAGRNTQDRIFVLSINEVKKYFAEDELMMCMPTQVAVSNGVTKENNGGCWWWLRNPGNGQFRASSVGFAGGINKFGLFVYDRNTAVRPAMWIALD